MYFPFSSRELVKPLLVMETSNLHFQFRSTVITRFLLADAIISNKETLKFKVNKTMSIWSFANTF